MERPNCCQVEWNVNWNWNGKKKINQNFSLKICSVTLLSTFWVKWADMSMMRKSWKIHFYFISFIGMLYFSNVHWKVMETVILESLLCEWPNNKTLHYRFTDELQLVLLSHIRETRLDKIMFGKQISIWSWVFFKQVLLICILNKDRNKKKTQNQTNKQKTREIKTTALCVKKIYTVTLLKAYKPFIV